MKAPIIFSKLRKGNTLQHPVSSFGNQKLGDKLTERSLRYSLILSILALAGRFLHEPIRWYMSHSMVMVTQFVEFSLILGAIYFAGSYRGKFFINCRNTVKSLRYSLPILVYIILFVVFNLLFRNISKTPSMEHVLLVIANNLFYPLVEEIEFRDFLLGFLRMSNMRLLRSVFVQSLFFLLAHHRYIWQQDWISFPFVFVSAFIYGYGTLRSETLLGAYIVHAASNIILLVFLG